MTRSWMNWIPVVLLGAAMLLCADMAFAQETDHAAEHVAVEAADDHGTAAHAPDAHGADAHGAAEHGEGEAAVSPFPSVIQGLIPAITTLLIFALLLAVLGRFAWGPIVSGLRQREDKIRRDISDAEAARARAEATLKEYSARLAQAEAQIREMISQAQGDAERTAAGIRARGQQEAEEIKERANRDIDASRKQAIAEIHEHAATLATSAAERILRRNLNPDDQRDLIDQSLQQLQTTKI